MSAQGITARQIFPAQVTDVDRVLTEVNKERGPLTELSTAVVAGVVDLEMLNIDVVAVSCVCREFGLTLVTSPRLSSPMHSVNVGVQFGNGKELLSTSLAHNLLFPVAVKHVAPVGNMVVEYLTTVFTDVLPPYVMHNIAVVSQPSLGAEALSTVLTLHLLVPFLPNAMELEKMSFEAGPGGEIAATHRTIRPLLVG